jgi:hypothetical protein
LYKAIRKLQSSSFVNTHRRNAPVAQWTEQ